MVIFVLSATVILMSFGIENTTGCEKPRLKLRVDPWTAALKPTPSISSRLVNPWLTPCTMLCTRLRESPCNAFALRVSAARTSDTRLSCTFAVISRGSVHCNFPLGPSTDTCPPSPTFTLTLSGISIALFPIRDMEFVILCYNVKSFPHVGQQLGADLLLSCFAPRQNASRSGKDRQTHSTKDPRDFIRAAVTAQTGETAPPHSRP